MTDSKWFSSTEHGNLLKAKGVEKGEFADESLISGFGDLWIVVSFTDGRHSNRSKGVSFILQSSPDNPWWQGNLDRGNKQRKGAETKISKTYL